MNIIIDSGGTTTRVAFTENSQTFKDIIKSPTPKKFQDYKGLLKSTIEKHCDIDSIKNIIFGVAGSVDRIEKKVRTSPHNSALNGKNIKEIFDFVKLPSEKIHIENDAALAALAESVFGEGKNFERVAYITISTGVGGARIVNKKLPTARFNYEPGHHIINFEGEPLALANIKGSFESYCSGTGFERRYGVNPTEYDNAELWNNYGEILAVGLHNISLLWQPQVIVLGGSMSKKAPLFIKSLNNKLEETLLSDKPEIKISNLGDENGLMGGMELLKIVESNH